jgi:hypothetical protein
MTAEVAIMNTKGIALAADSAATLGSGNGKVYNTADKLFALSKYHPVGIMIYGWSKFMGIDWEVIVKSYRDFLDKKSFDKLSNYTGDFINYLSKFPYFENTEMLEYLEYRCFEVFSHVLTWFLDDLHKEFDSKENIELSEINSLFDKTLRNIKEQITQQEDEKQIKLDTDFIDSNSETIKKELENVFENYKLSKEQIAELTSILKLDFQKCGWVDDYSGIVIAGYGEREIFPTLCEFKISGKLGDSLIYFGRDTTQITTDWRASIAPFSQTEMVYRFVLGIDPDLDVTTIKKVQMILDSLSPLLKDSDREKTKAIAELMKEYLDDFQIISYKKPIYDIVACMEKSELVSMAEAMVNLTALKRHVSDDEESVGGPIDVALITKGDGFIWIKKKTSYDPHLNRELNQNYFRS